MNRIYSSIVPLVFFLSILGSDMAFGKKITFFSEMTGQLVNEEGEEQVGVKVTRSWKRRPEDKPTVDQTVTDSSGKFMFPAATDTSFLASFLPGTPVIKQEITAEGPNGLVTLWKAVKTNFDNNGELQGRPFRLICRIDKEPDGEGPAWGTCQELQSE